MLEDPYDYQPQPGSRFWSWTLIGWLFVVGLFGAGVATCAQGAPRVANAEECGLVADMVLVAAALLKHDVAGDKRAAILEDTYRTALGGGEAKKWRELLNIAVLFVRRDQVRGIEPQDLADAVGEGCQRARGNLEPIFGSES